MSINIKHVFDLNHKAALGAAMTVALTSAAMPSTVIAADPATEEVVVTGIRGSLRQNLDVKRDANSVVDAITAQDIGKFPDKNVAESLQRLPGVSISRSYGEGEQVSIRGTAPGMNRTLVNGQNLGTTMWEVIEDFSRGFNYSVMASEMIAGLELYKSPQADIDEGSVGGTINLRTRRPFELDSMTFQASVEGQYGDQAEKWDPSVSGLFSWKNDDETFGALISVTHQERTLYRDGSEALNTAGSTFDVNGVTAIAPWGLGSALFEGERDRTGVNLALQFAPSEQWDMTFNYLNSKMNTDNTNNNFLPIIHNLTFTNERIENGILTYGDFSGAASGVAAAYDVIYRDGTTMETESVDFDVNYSGDGYRVHAQVGQTTGESRITDMLFEFFSRAGDPRYSGTYSVNRHYNWDLNSDVLTNPGDSMFLGKFFDQTNNVDDDETYVQADVEFDVEWGAFNQVKFGIKHRDHDFSQYRAQVHSRDIGETYTSATFQDGVNSGLHSESGMTPPAYWRLNKQKALALFNELSPCTSSTDTHCLDSYQLYSSSYDINEETFARYVMANFESENIRGNLGARIVTTEVTNEYWGTVGGSRALITDTQKYTDTLPSINIAYDLSDDVVMRAAASKVISRPNPTDLTGASNLTVETLKGSGGNTKLEPYRANQYEMGVEWYFDEGAILALTSFRKDIGNFIYKESAPETIDGLFLSNGVTRPKNGPSVSINGFELQYQQELAGGFGITANYTFTDADNAIVQTLVQIDTDGDGNTDQGVLRPTTVRVPGNSEDTINLSAYYENDVVSARLSYNFRSEYFKQLQAGGNLFRDEQTQWDLTSSYYLSENITLRAEILNLTEETVVDYWEDNDGLGQRVPEAEFENGRRFYLGASLKY